jgi:hypothetical protein
MGATTTRRRRRDPYPRHLVRIPQEALDERVLDLAAPLLERLGTEPRLSCVMELPDGVEAHVPPPIEKRVAIGGKFLDETQIRRTATSYLSFPVEAHRGVVGDDGTVTVRTKMPTAVALLAEGVLPPIGGGSVELSVQGKKLDAMVLSETRCDANRGHHDIAILIFRAAASATEP